MTIDQCLAHTLAPCRFEIPAFHQTHSHGLDVAGADEDASDGKVVMFRITRVSWRIWKLNAWCISAARERQLGGGTDSSHAGQRQKRRVKAILKCVCAGIL